jgi:RsiW-degrading membrane proteinase PrsW (M82 family)
MIASGAVFDWTTSRPRRTVPTQQKSGEDPVSSKSHATLRYTAMRAGVFAGCLVVVAVLAYAGIIPEGIGKSNPLWVVLVALVISAPLSFVLLRRQRDAMSEQIVGGVDRAKERLVANQQQEDSPA